MMYEKEDDLMQNILEEYPHIAAQYIPTFNAAISRISRRIVFEYTGIRNIKTILRELKKDLEKEYPYHEFDMLFCCGEYFTKYKTRIACIYIVVEIRFPDRHCYSYNFFVPDIKREEFMPYGGEFKLENIYPDISEFYY